MGRVLAIRPEPPLTAMLNGLVEGGRHHLEICGGNLEALRRVRAARDRRRDHGRCDID